MKEYVPRARTLAIGDGANDVSMIQEAHVGIGIFGHEGMQAAMNSDYAIAQFKYLKNLLLVHGRWSYKRTARLVLYSFYKNATLALCLFWYSLYSEFSAMNFFDSWSLSGFNVIFTAFPILIYSIFDKDVNVATSLDNPKLYVEGQKNLEFGIRILWGWVGIGLWNSVVIFFGVILWFEYGIIEANGTSHGMWALGITAFSVVVIVTNLKVAVETNYWTILTFVTVGGSILVWFIFSLIYSSMCSNGLEEMCYVVHRVYGAATYWFLILILAIICLLPDFTYKYLQRNYKPTPSQVAQEIQRIKRKERKKLKKFPMIKQEIKKVDTGVQVKQSSHTGYAFSAEDEGSSKAIEVSFKQALRSTFRRLETKEMRRSRRELRRELKRQGSSSSNLGSANDSKDNIEMQEIPI